MFKRLTIGVFWTVVVATGLIILLRAFLGPLPMHIHSPMNAESIFGLAMILILLARSTRDVEGTRASQPLRFRSCMLASALLVIIAGAFWRSIYFYFLSDDFILLKLANDHLYLRDIFATPGGDGFFRPVGYVSLALTSLWASYNPAFWHLSALAWHAANSLLVFILSLQTGFSRIAAFFAAMLFAIHGSRPEAVAWMASHFDRVSVFFVLAGVILFVQALSTEKNRSVCIFLSLACMTLGILCKESAYVLPLLLLAFMLSKPDLRWRQYRILIPYFAVAAILFAYRLILFGGIGGYTDAQTGRPSASIVAIIPTVKVLLLRLWAVLFFPINWSKQPGFVLSVLLVFGIVSICMICAGRVSRRRIFFPLGFLLISALPAMHLLLIGSDLQKARLLYLPSVGFCLLLAVAAGQLPPRWRLAVPGALVVFNIAVLQHNLDRWGYASGKARDACSAAVRCIGPRTGKVSVSGLPGSIDGVYFFANGFPECIGIQSKNFSGPMEFLSGDAGASLSWDEAKEELRCR